MRWSILAIGAALLISAAILHFSAQYASHALRDKLSAQSQLNDARSRLTSARQDETNMHFYFAEHLALEKQKIIGEDQRLDWVEGLERIRQMNLVSAFRYHIAPQKPYASPSPIDSGNYDIRYSEMKLQFDLLHEAQLLSFFDVLRSQINGWYQLEGCTLQRVTTAQAEVQNSSPKIKAECSGGWITLKNRNTLR